ncbi:Glycosyl transferase family 1 [Candidatus Desulfarcum epimagneticum]|uniref:Glycosyl transferase family 1 n=1 Tax=uncultured Desulfobacteraceae bacterium TaxID=218296 RepID=A0A484HIN9_9BACT|nr:Glycosyl transferase family 1 [uncultured Desulfobacteraceae bacterium]
MKKNQTGPKPGPERSLKRRRSLKQDRPLKICLVSYRSNPHCGGQGVYLKNLSRALKRLGHHVEALSGPPDPMLDPDVPVHRPDCLDLYNPEDLFRVPFPGELADPVNLLEWMGVSTMGFPEPFTFGLRAYRFLRKNPGRYDIIHDNQSLSYGIWALSRLVPVIATIHHPITVDRRIAFQNAGSFIEKMQALRWFSFLGMQKTVSRRLLRIITVSKASARDIGRDFDIPRDRFEIVPNGIDTRLFKPVPGVVREKNRLIVTTSSDTPLKGLEHLLKALWVVSKIKKVRLVVIGTPKKDGDILKLIRRLEIGERVRFTGRVSDRELVRHYARASVAVTPSVYEGFGLPAGEAMACGVPVISTTGGALPEVVGDAGVLVPPSDFRALARGVLDLLNHPHRAAELGRAGFERVQARFTWEKAAEKTVAAHRKAIRDFNRF